jgi:hypothetical protein
VLARINFLLGLGLLILIAFYYAGVYLLIPPVSAIAPDWVKPVAGIALLAAVGITVQLLSMAMSGLRGVALYRQGERAGLTTYVSQAAFIFGHAGTLYAAKSLVIDAIPVSGEQVVIIAALYGAGAALALLESRHRKLSRP